MFRATSSFVDVIRPNEKSQAIVFDSLTIFAGSLFLALLAQIAIPLWFTPVPLSLQSLGVLMIGGILGRKKGAMATVAYLLEGSLGLPFFAGGASGMSVLIGPTAGYLFGFVVASWLIGHLLEKGKKERLSYTMATMSVGASIVLFFGALWLSFFVGGIGHAITLGVLPFIVGEVIKIVAAAALIPSGWKLISALK